MNIASIIRTNAANLGDKTAFVCGQERISYSQLWPRICRLSTAFKHSGVGPGDVVGLLMKDHPEHVLAHFAVAQLGAIILPLDHRWTDTERNRAIVNFGAKLVVCDQAFACSVTSLVIGDIPNLANDIPGNTQDTDQSETSIALASDTPIAPCQSDSVVLYSLSSGTTGAPKAAWVTHQNLYERFVSQWAAIGYGGNDCFAVVTPLFFGAGRSFAMSILTAGGTLKLAPPPLKPEALIRELQDETVTATFLPPTMLRRLFQYTDDASLLLGHLKYLIVSGEPLHAEEAQQCLRTVCENLFAYYASSEGGGISVLPSSDIVDHAATVGKPTFRTEVDVVDAQGQPVALGTVGRLRYRGPGVATHFVDGDGNASDTGDEGWFYPGDLAEKLPTGHLQLRGRDKETIIRGGVNIYPSEIEATLSQHPDVNEVAVLGVEDAQHGQLVVAFIGSEMAILDTTLDSYCRERLAPYKVPSQFIMLTTLPKRTSGKIDKKALASRLSA